MKTYASSRLLKATQFRQNLFSVLDEVHETGQPMEIERGGERFILSPVLERKPMGSVKARPWICPEPEGLESFSPSAWNPDGLP